MAFKNGAYATVWETRATKGPSRFVRISTSYKSKTDGKYVDDFSGWVFFSGAAAGRAEQLKEKDRIKLLECSVNSQYNREKKETSYSFYVWDFEQAEQGGKGTRQSAAEPPKAPVAADEDELPF